VQLAVRKGIEKSAKIIGRPSNNPEQLSHQFANMSDSYIIYFVEIIPYNKLIRCLVVAL